MKVLSLDWDYFITASLDTRDYFPTYDPNDTPSVIREKWAEKFIGYAGLDSIPVDEHAVSLLTNFLMGRRFRNKFVCESHEGILRMLGKEKDLEIVNVDFHHDYYTQLLPDGSPSCGSWLQWLDAKERCKSISWCRREDSEMYSLLGNFPHESFTDLSRVFKGASYDAVFFCFSTHWAPPHTIERAKEVALSILAH